MTLIFYQPRCGTIPWRGVEPPLSGLLPNKLFRPSWLTYFTASSLAALKSLASARPSARDAGPISLDPAETAATMLRLSAQEGRLVNSPFLIQHRSRDVNRLPPRGVVDPDHARKHSTRAPNASSGTPGGDELTVPSGSATAPDEE